MILTIRTDKPESEIGLFDSHTKVAYQSWYAHRQLAETIHHRISIILEDNNKTLGDISGIVVYKGPGSFTGLRIGMSVANALAYSMDVPIVAHSGADWTGKGIDALQNGQNENSITPEYGSAANITKPRK